MDNEQIATLLEKTGALADTVAPALGAAAPAVAAVRLITQAIADELRASEATTEEIVSRIRKAEQLTPPPWQEGPESEPKKKRRTTD